MKTYILFTFGDFREWEEILDFITVNFKKIDSLYERKFIIEANKNIFIQFSTDLNEKELANNLYTTLNNSAVKFYFLFNRDNVVSSYLPDSVLQYIFSEDIKNDSYITIEYEKNNEILNIDTIIDKIKEVGIDNLTPKEKKFLNNFEN